MRETLFRGKTKDRWVYGSLINGIAGAVPVIVTLPSVDDSFKLEFDYDHVYPESVGQYTGMKDKNGKEIFEGDIVVYDNTPYSAYGRRLTCEIIFRKCQWQGKYAEFEGGYYYALSADDFFGAKSEVIGNVYDNPELLGGADNGAN